MLGKQSLLFYGGYTTPETGGIHVYNFSADVEVVDGKPEYTNIVRPLFPKKGFPYPEAIADCNFIKRFFMSEGRFFSKKLALIAGITTVFLPFKLKIRLLEHWIQAHKDFFNISLENHYLQERYLTEVAREILKFIQAFLIKLGISEESAYTLARTFAHLIEYDTAYRWRILDIMSESKKEYWSNPTKELKRLIGILAERDNRTHLVEKFDNYAKILSVVLKFPKIKRAFQETMEASEFKNFQYDEIDRHTVMPLDGYKFFGEDTDSRLEKYIALYNGKPPIAMAIN